MLLHVLISLALATKAFASSPKPQCWRDTTCTGPRKPAFRGPWEENHFAPEQRVAHPRSVLSLPAGDLLSEYGHEEPHSLSGDNPALVYDFGLEVGGILTIDYDVKTTGPSANATLGIAFTEAKDYIGKKSDNSNGETGQDGALQEVITKAGPKTYVMPDAQLRGGFRYLTLFIDNASEDISIEIKKISLEISFQPTWSNLRAYQGYFHSNDELLNKIWYAGAYTLQTNSVPANTCRVDVSKRPGWQNDEFCGPGSSILLDGAKRDRWVWIGDMGTAVPSAFFSTGDLESTRNALLAIYDYQSPDGTLPKAGPPYLARDSDTYHLWTLIGTYNYFLYTDDREFLADIWPKYTKALSLSLSKVNDKGIMNVTGEADWGRWTYEPERSSANMLLYRALQTGASISSWAPELPEARSSGSKWTETAKILRRSILKELWDEDRGAFKDSPSNTTLFPQDANSLALAFNIFDPSSSEAERISDYLKSNWTPIGPSCPELDNNVSPFISSLELIGHFHVGRGDRALQLIRDAWGWYLTHPNGTQSTVPEGYLVDGTWGYRGDRGYRNDPSYVSHAHGWSSGPTSTMSEYLVGLRVTEPNGREWRLEPVSLGEVSKAEAGFTTGLGKFSAKYVVSKDKKKATVQWSAPKGTRGYIKLPGQKGRWVKGGKGSAVVTLWG